MITGKANKLLFSGENSDKTNKKAPLLFHQRSMKVCMYPRFVDMHKGPALIEVLQ